MPVSLEIVTPDATVYAENGDQVVVPTANGKIDILPHHVPIIDKLIAGDLKVERNGVVEYLAVSSGFVEVYSDKVSILTDEAINISDQDDSKIEEAVKRALQRSQERKDARECRKPKGRGK